MLIWNDPKIIAASAEMTKDLESITDPHFLMWIGEKSFTKEDLLNEIQKKTQVGLDLVNNFLTGINLTGGV